MFVADWRKNIDRFPPFGFLVKLGAAAYASVQKFFQVKFVPLNIEDEESIGDLLMLIDNTIQYGEDLEVRRFKL